ncbi:MAG: hypothetical protein ACOCVF_03595 [bacterium]
MVIFVDIDNTICENNDNLDYSKSTPIKNRINEINNLYDNGHKIIYWTARGTISRIDWKDITIKQFKDWGVKYHELKFEKPYFDLFIDDKAINTSNFFNV